MIHDHLDQLDAYASLMPGFAEALSFLRTQPLMALDTGRHDIDGDRLFCIIDRYTPRGDDEQVWETHERYADVQLMVSGSERMGVVPRKLSSGKPGLGVKTPYDAERDATFYQPATHADGPVWLTMTPGRTAVFLPQDIHAPGLALRGHEAKPVTKAVVKVRVG